MHTQNQKGFTHQNLKKVSGGFTIIEVILYLALSSSFLFIAFLGISGRTANLQFTDSMRSLHSFLVSEQNKVMNGVNSATTSPCGSPPAVRTGTNEDCVLIGRVVTFGADSANLSILDVNVLYGEKLSTRILTEAGAGSDIDLIRQSGPKTDNTSEQYEINWEVKFVADKSRDSSGIKIDKLGWLRSPGSSALVPIIFENGIDIDGNYYDIGIDGASIGDEVGAKFCFSGIKDKVASINFDKNSSITLVFDDEVCE